MERGEEWKRLKLCEGGFVNRVGEEKRGENFFNRSTFHFCFKRAKREREEREAEDNRKGVGKI